MCWITLIAPTITMATTQFTPEVRREPCCWLARGRELHAPRMSWVVVTDENQNRRMQMVWVPSAD